MGACPYDREVRTGLSGLLLISWPLMAGWIMAVDEISTVDSMYRDVHWPMRPPL